MKAVIIHLPGSNRVRDTAQAFIKVTSYVPKILWSGTTTLPKADLVIIPGGFSYGDYLRCGAIAAQLPLFKSLRQEAKKGLPILGICNGFQILLELRLLPGALMPNKRLSFISKFVKLKVNNNHTLFTSGYRSNEIIMLPVAHKGGNYFADKKLLEQLKDDNQIVFSYLNDSCDNGSVEDIAGIINKEGTILGMMPHPENAIESYQASQDGLKLFSSLLL